jgi:hypothetical protein
MNDIQKELASLKGEQEQHAKDSSQYSGLERTYEGLLTAVKTLEVTLLNTSTSCYTTISQACVERMQRSLETVPVTEG